jgi:prepilin-type N-terminal cleavage/methylation domain-containing protein
MRKFFKNQKGFTLIELMTAVSIFAIVMTISLGSIVGVFDANRKSRAMKSVMSNLNLAVESMSKEMRFGKNYHCGTTGQETSPQNCSSGATYLSFLDNGGEQVVYRLNNQAIEKNIQNRGFIAITAPEVVVDNLVFYTLGAGTGNTLQPRILMIVKAHSGTGPERSDLVLQTLVSQRAIDI